LLVDPPQSGAWNMALDDALLNDATVNDIATLRFYEWNAPTLSLGYFQKYADRSQHPASQSAEVVRRQTGGGAILHDQELTYSLAMPRSHPLTVEAHLLYDAVHNVIADVLRSHLPHKLPATVLRISTTESPDKPFLCFQRRSPGDILFVDGESPNSAVYHKLVGSAQRRSRAAILQHGSILLVRSAQAPELAGVNDVCDTKWTTTCLASELSARLTQAFNFEVVERVLRGQTHQSAVVLQAEKYGNPLWIQRR
jgi:lipoyl(octanoyl) transferase